MPLICQMSALDCQTTEDSQSVLDIEIQKGRVRMCSIFQVDGFIGIVQLVVPFSAWGSGTTYIPRLLCSAHMLFLHKTTHKDYHSKNHIL